MRPRTRKNSLSEDPAAESFVLVQPGKVVGLPGIFLSNREFLAQE
jgi:hypothetical protein